MIDDTSLFPIQRIRFWEHWGAAKQAFRDYAPGVDATVDRLRSANQLVRLLTRHLLGPLYLSTGEGWAIRGSQGDIAAILYLRRHDHQGSRVLHIDNIEVAVRYRRQGLAQRLFAFAEEKARRERYAFLTLAVTVANAPAVMLYHRLGYQAQHHRFFTFDVPPFPESIAIPHQQTFEHFTCRVLTKAEAASLRNALYHGELERSLPDLARVLIANYPLRSPNNNQSTLAYAIEQAGHAVGYCDVWQQETTGHLQLGLLPELWGSREESAILSTLIGKIRHMGTSHVALSLMSAAHHAALGASHLPLIAAYGLVEKSTERMVMIKTLSG